jgi:hypothetical protein
MVRPKTFIPPCVLSCGAADTLFLLLCLPAAVSPAGEVVGS